MIRGELFNQDMVKAFLENRKFRTSRPIKNVKIEIYKATSTLHGEYYRVSLTEKDDLVYDGGFKDFDFIINDYARHRIGDVIYARETFDPVGTIYKFPEQYIYKASPELFPNDILRWMSGLKGDLKLHWHPSIHMPRSAARLWFRVTDVKVQKLEDVTEQDAVEDGFKYKGWAPTFNDPDSGGDGECETPLDQFQEFWLNQYGGNQPWMWVYYLKPITKEEALKDEK
jgi:hypothetical protein